VPARPDARLLTQGEQAATCRPYHRVITQESGGRAVARTKADGANVLSLDHAMVPKARRVNPLNVAIEKNHREIRLAHRFRQGDAIAVANERCVLEIVAAPDVEGARIARQRRARIRRGKGHAMPRRESDVRRNEHGAAERLARRAYRDDRRVAPAIDDARENHLNIRGAHRSGLRAGAGVRRARNERAHA